MTSTTSLSDQPAWLGCASIAKKFSDTELRWPVPLETAARDMYPKGELTVAPH